MPGYVVRVEISPDTHDNWLNWGKLVKTWATGNNYFGDGHHYPRPDSLHELRAQLKHAKVSMTNLDAVQGLQFIAVDYTTLVIRLPPKALIEKSEADLRALAANNTASSGFVEYPLHSFYTNEAFAAQPQVKFSVDQLLDFHCERIGEYTINNCN